MYSGKLYGKPIENLRSTEDPSQVESAVFHLVEAARQDLPEVALLQKRDLRIDSIWVCLKMLCTPKPNGFADHYPYEKWL